jgi:hypothetical protein
LSVLTQVQVYTTVGTGWNGPGKGHAPHCQHADRSEGGLDSRYELLTLAEILDQENYDWCSKCGGYAIRWLNEAQVRYYRAAHRLCEINSALESHRTSTVSPAENQERAAAWRSELEVLARLRPEPPTGPHDDGNTAWCRKVKDVMAKLQ